MPLPTNISQLSQTAGSNSPSGSESPSLIDDYLRLYASYIALHRDGAGFTAEATVASAATTDIGAATSFYVNITGTTTITSFGTNYNGPRLVRVTSSLTLTNSATLVLPGGSNITTFAGDSFIAEPIGNPATGWQVVSYQSAQAPGFSSSRVQPITASVGSNALTLGLNPTILDFRSGTLTTGTGTTVTIPSALSLTVPATATLGTTNGVAARLVLLVAYNGGTPVLCVTNLAGGLQLDETNLISPTTISVSATSASVIYSASAVSANSPYRVVGFVDISEATAGTWATAPTLVQGVGGQALAALSSPGYGQTYQDVTASRATGTTYYNTTGKPIKLQIYVANSAASGPFGAILTINSVQVSGFYLIQQTGAGNYFNTLEGVVPPGGSYSVGSVVSATANKWVELR